MDYEVVVIGGGQAGLAMGHALARQGRRFAILDAAPAPGHSWRTRWESLKLFTPARYSALPGLPFPGDPEHYPDREAVADYLRSYVDRFDLPLRSGTRVLALDPLAQGGFAIHMEGGGLCHAGQVVVATGPFQQPSIPRLADRLSMQVIQLHSSEYRRPDQLPAGPVLVVGGGNSGVQIAAELAATRRTTLALGEKLVCLPERLFGRSIFWHLEKAGAMRITADSRLGQRARRKELLIGERPARLARERGVHLVGRATDAEGERVHVEGGSRVEAPVVIWATGFRSDYQWIHAPVLDSRGAPIHRRGVTAVPGLYLLGLPWQHTRGSALIGWVGEDAAFLAERIGERAGAVRRAA